MITCCQPELKGLQSWKALQSPSSFQENAAEIFGLGGWEFSQGVGIDGNDDQDDEEEDDREDYDHDDDDIEDDDPQNDPSNCP